MSEKKIIGRKKEIEVLSHVRGSKKAEFIAVYGRRRVGKTFLIREYFKNKGLYLETAGVKNLSLPLQLKNFAKALSKTFFKDHPVKTPHSWSDAFEQLTQLIKEAPKNKKIIIFLDELPWLAAKRSGLMQALEYNWNLFWSQIPNMILVVCGSAASWMLEHVVNAKGGLYNRLTKKLLLKPFGLKETKQFLQAQGILLTNRQILDVYMVMGGVPYYLTEIRKGQSSAQIIDNLCFKENGVLFDEFKNLFRSLFDHAEINSEIVRQIADKGVLSREQLINTTHLSSGGTLNKRLDELEASGFIKTFIPLGKLKRDKVYRVIDEYALFYLKWIEPLLKTGMHSGEKGYWSKISKQPIKTTWAGFAFESVCLKHIDQITHALDLDDIHYKCGSWIYRPPKKSSDIGAQIDLLIDRDDHVLSLCEIKYTDKVFTIDKPYARALLNKIDTVERNYPTTGKPSKKQIFLVLITTLGVKKNIYSEDLVQSALVLEDLFKKV